MSATSLIEHEPGLSVRAYRQPGRALDTLAFGVPVLIAVDIAGPGRLYGAEVILLLLFPVLLHRRRSTNVAPIPPLFVGLMLVWLDGQIATDVFRATPLHDLSRGWSKILFTLINFVALYLIIENRPKRILLFAYGFAVGLLLQYAIHPNPYAAAEPWKFGYGYAVTLALVLVASDDRLGRWPSARIGVLAASAALNLMHDSRSLAAICALAAFYVCFTQIRSRSQGRVQGAASVLRGVGVAVGLFATALSFGALYGHFAGSGALGREASQKYAAQGSGGSLGLLSRARPEIYVSAQAVADSPLLGHGSWARDPKYVQMEYARGLHPSSAMLASGLIPTHSHLMGAWVEAGILGVAVWLWCLALAARVIARLYRTSTQLTPLIAFAALALVWDVLFSPFGALQRIVVPFYLLILLYADRQLGPPRGSL